MTKQNQNGSSQHVTQNGPLRFSRVIFRDSFLHKDFKARDVKELYEYKYETAIDRQTGLAKDLREIERVVPGPTFSLEVVLRYFETDNVQAMKSLIFEGFDLLAKDYLGGMGTRGYGQVEIEWLDPKQKTEEK